MKTMIIIYNVLDKHLVGKGEKLFASWETNLYNDNLVFERLFSKTFFNLPVMLLIKIPSANSFINILLMCLFIVMELRQNECT